MRRPRQFLPAEIAALPQAVVDQAIRAHILSRNTAWHQLWPFDDRAAIDWPAVLKHLRETRCQSYPKPKPCAKRWETKRELYAGVMPDLMMKAGPEKRTHGLSRTDAAKLILGFRSIVFHNRAQFIQDAKDSYDVVVHTLLG